jgi:hypothetical protein
MTFDKSLRKSTRSYGKYGNIRLLIDASEFGGWEDLSAFEGHASFVKDHQQKVERLAVLTAHDWQRWLIAAVRIFVHPELRAFDKQHAEAAMQWVVG